MSLMSSSPPSPPSIAPRLWCMSRVFVFLQILERVAREELDVPVLKTRHIIKVLLVYVKLRSFF